MPSTSRRGWSRRPTPGEVLIGAATLALVGAAAEVEEVEPLELKGKPEPVPAFRLARGRGGARPSARPAASSDARASSRCSREAWKRARGRARVRARDGGRRGRRRQVAPRRRGARGDRRAGRPGALPSLRRGDHLLARRRGDQAARRAARPTRRRPPRSGRCSARANRRRRADEIAWAFRKLLEEQAPLVVLLRRHPVGRGDVPRPRRATWRCSRPARRSCSLCIARPELLERRPSWPVAVRLEPLARDEVDALIGDRVAPEAARADRSERPGGNPLFITEMLAMAATAGRGRGAADAAARCSPPGSTSSTPPSARCSSAARSRARSSTAAPCRRSRPRSRTSLPRLAALVRRELIRPDRAAVPGRGRLPLPPPADPRRRLRRSPEGGPRRPARAASPTGSRARRPSSSWTSSSATTSSRPPATRPSWAGPTTRSRSARAIGC